MDDAVCFRVSMTLEAAVAERLADTLGEHFLPPPDAVGLFEDEREGSRRVEAWFAERPGEAELARFLADHGAGETDFSIDAIPDADWVAVTQAQLHPVRAGRFLVHGSHDRARIVRHRFSIEIDAARAFGTAHHGSTRGCLAMLDRLAKRERFVRILDLGTGTGVLAIAAARLWRAPVLASDIDPVATQTVRENVRRNGAQALVAAVTASGLAHARIRRNVPYDLVIANILARPLIELAPAIARATRRGGVVVLSGITQKQAKRVAASFAKAGFTRCRSVSFGEWTTLALRRR
jgi:ribosomal protein L11 methyltransferase